ncbi:hypothetical protein FOA52_010603 [Chlamydomonas sp. UWO 241]|nr:hypothetical protein FOA52_010603 [Chlamydomonas sp. UWO 241]
MPHSSTDTHILSRKVEVLRALRRGSRQSTSTAPAASSSFTEASDDVAVVRYRGK